VWGFMPFVARRWAKEPLWLCSVRGASPIIAVDIKKHCLEMVASRFGATHTLLANGESVSERIMNVTQGEGAEVVFLTAGVSVLVQESLAVVKRKGTIVLLALFDEPITMEAFDLIQKDANVVGSSMYNEDDIQTALALIASHRIKPEGMVTHELSVAEAQRGFEIFDSKEDEAVKVVLYFGGA
jgi:threonine dehydrogenase-like Zn-dependent dehydrogenase